jgi:hypothetical protein
VDGARFAAAALLCIGAGGCAIETEVGYNEVDRADVATVPWQFQHSLDVLFVVDDRTGMRGVAAEAASMWTRMRGSLVYAEGGFPDVHVGVVSADMGVGDASVPGCTAAGADGALDTDDTGARWLSIDASNEEISDGQVLSRVAIPDAGCEYDQPLAAIQRALDGSQPLNDGFRRPDAALAIIIVGGDDDCSVDDAAFWAVDGDGVAVSPFRCFREAVHCSGDDVYVGQQNGCKARQVPPHLIDATMSLDFVNGLVSGPTHVVITAVTGDKDNVTLVDDGAGQLAVASACSDPSRPMMPGVRLAGFMQQFGEDAFGEDVATTAGACDPSWGGSATTETSAKLREAMGHRCLKGNVLDVEPETPGLQVDCVVEAVRAGAPTRTIAACPNPNDVMDAKGPCYAIKDGVAPCGDFPSGLALQMNWGGDDPMTQPEGVIANVHCVVGADPPVD